MNKNLIRRVLEKIEASPEQWDQGQWGRTTECGTTFCVAGWACSLSGYQPVRLEGFASFDDMVSPSGRVVDVEKEGARLLGLSKGNAEILFFNQDKIHVLNLLREWSA